MQRVRGIVYTVLSAIIFGTTPVLIKLSTAAGMNATTNIFFRGLVAITICFVCALVQKKSVLLKGKQLKDAMIAFIVGQGCTSILLYISYDYLASGMATTLHFIYPSIVMLACVVLFKERMNLLKIASLCLSITAVALMADMRGTNRLVGMMLALCSGCTFATYVVFLEHSSVRDFSIWRYVFWSGVGCATAAGAFGLATGTVTFAGVQPKAYLIALVMVLTHSVLALRLFQLGVRDTGSTEASILSTMEPVTSIVCGVLFLNETMDVWKLIGCGAIVLSVILVVLGTKQTDTTPLRVTRGIGVRK